jgi:cold shock CspA family protein
MGAGVMTGTVSRLNIDRGFGFIASPGQPDIFFHFSDLADGLRFEDALLELRVEFDITEAGKGPRARNVQPAE